jgi:hypothetical protein
VQCPKLASPSPTSLIFFPSFCICNSIAATMRNQQTSRWASYRRQSSKPPPLRLTLAWCLSRNESFGSAVDTGKGTPPDPSAKRWVCGLPKPSAKLGQKSRSRGGDRAEWNLEHSARFVARPMAASGEPGLASRGLSLMRCPMSNRLSMRGDVVEGEHMKSATSTCDACLDQHILGCSALSLLSA